MVLSEKFVSNFNIDIQTICNMIIGQVIDHEYCELFNPEDVAQLGVLKDRITNATALDNDFKRVFNNDMECTFYTASQNAFENGLNIGLRLLQTLLNAKLQDGMINNEPDIIKQCKPMKRDSGYNPTFIDFVEKTSPYLSITQKLQLEGRIKCLLSENMERDIGISRKTNGGIL